MTGQMYWNDPFITNTMGKKRGNKLTEAEAHKMHVSLNLSFVVIDKKMLNKVPDLVWSVNKEYSDRITPTC